MIAFGERIASTTAPTLPGSNTSIFTSSTGATTSFRVWCHVASGASDGTGTATNATGGVVAFWFSGTSATTTGACATQGIAIGVVATANQQYSASGTSLTISGLTMSSGTDSSWIVTFTGTNTSGDACVPAGITNPTTPAGYIQGGTSNGPLASWAQTTCTITTSVGRSFALEILAADSGVGSGTPTCSNVVDQTEPINPNAATGYTQFQMAHATGTGNMIRAICNFTPGDTITFTDDKEYILLGAD